MKINHLISVLNTLKDGFGDIDVHILIHDNKKNKNLLSESIHAIYYDEKTNSVELFGFLSKDNV